LPHLTLVAVGAFYINYVEDVAGYSDSKASKLLSVAQGIFTLGRFMCTLAMRWVHAKYILATFISILVVIAALASAIDGTAAVVLYTLLFLFER
jgi:FHS family L-fucose permease-like MFS transporter